MFPLIYVLPIILAAMFLFRRGAYVISLSTVAFFFGLLLLEANSAMYPMRFVIYRFYIFALLFLFTAILSGALSENYQKRTEEVRRLRLTTEEILNNLPSGIITVDSKGEIIYTNIEAERLRTEVHFQIARFLKSDKPPASIELEIEQRFYVLACARIYDSKAALGVLQDVTEIRKLEEASRISKQTRLLAELGGSLAHEIRNPLASIRGSLEVISENVKKAKVQPFIGMAMKESIRLNEIVTDFLKFAQFTPKKMNKVHINEVLNEALIEVIRDANQKHIVIKRIDGDFYVLADLNKLKSVFVNVLYNACEVSKEGGTVELEAYRTNQEGYVAIRDYGCGIGKKDLEKIFEPFYTTKKGGTGLGLAIAKNIIEAHNGRIDVRSTVGKGSTFTVVMPIA